MIKDLTFETTSKQFEKQNKEYVCVLDHYRAKIEEMQTEAAQFIYWLSLVEFCVWLDKINKRGEYKLKKI